MLENLKNNKDFINQGKKSKFYYFLIESPLKLNNNIQIENFAYFYELNHVNFNVNDDKFIEIALKKLKFHMDIDTGTKFYILRIKIVDLTQKKVEHPVTKLSQIIDPEIGIGISPSNICKDLLNLFSLYFGAWFKIVPSFLFWEDNDTFSLIKSDFREIPHCKEGDDLTLNFHSIAELREEQFYLIQKSLSKFNQSLITADDDIELGFVLLVSTIENLSRKYGEVEEKFDESIKFYHKLKKIFKNIRLNKNIEESILLDLFNNIGDAFLKISYLQTKGKYKKFCLTYVSTQFHNEKFEEMIGNLYDLRSKILHAGESLGFRSREEIIMYNPRTRSGKIKKYKDEKGEHSIILRIPSYNDLLKIFGEIIINFIRYLFSVKDDETDKSLYKESDIKKRNIIWGSIKKGGFKPGYIVNLNTDFYRKIDYIDLIQIQNNLKYIEKKANKSNLEKNLAKINEIIQHPNFSMDYVIFRRAYYFKIIFLHDLKRYNECLDMFKINQINEINNETFIIFNTKAYCMAKLGIFKEAHQIIDEIIKKVENNDKDKANFLDSKGDFYKIEGNYQKAIKFYIKSLMLKSDPPFSFHKKTKEKLKECQKKVKNIKDF